MKTASVQELKAELASLDKKKIIEVTLRLIRSKLENKELASYMLFDSSDEQQYVLGVRSELNVLFKEINTSHLYFARKSLRKIVRLINKYCRFSGKTETEVDLRLYFCETLMDSGIPFRKSEVLQRMYDGQLKKAEIACERLHEDAQYDFSARFRLLSEPDF